MMTTQLPDVQPLDPKMRMFAIEYSKDFNGPEAMERAGYPSALGWKAMLTDKRVEAVVREELNKRGLRSRIDPDEVLRELEAMAFTSPGELIDIIEKVDEHTGEIVSRRPMLRPIHQLPTAAMKSIKEIEITQLGGVKLKLHDKKAALELLGKHLGLFNGDNDKRDITVTVKQFKEGEDDGPEDAPVATTS